VLGLLDPSLDTIRDIITSVATGDTADWKNATRSWHEWSRVSFLMVVLW